MTKIYRAVLHILSPLQYQLIYNLAHKVYSALVANATTFKIAEEHLQELSSAIAQLLFRIGEAESGDHTKIALRKDQSQAVIDLLKGFVNEVNTVAKGSKSTVLLSGFDANEENETLPVPAKILIKRIIAGPEENTVKIMIIADQFAKVYKLEWSETPDDPKSWALVVDTTSSYKLIAHNVPKKKEIYYRVSAGNSNGWGLLSNPISFYLQ